MKKNDMQILYNQFIRLNNKFSAIKKNSSIEICENVNLYPSEMQVLSLLSEHSNLTVSEVALKLSITKSAASQLVKRLCNKNMLYKDRNNENERIVLLSLTDEGKKVVENFFLHITHTFIDFSNELSGISENDVSTISFFMNRLEKMFDKKLQ